MVLPTRPATTGSGAPPISHPEEAATALQSVRHSFHQRLNLAVCRFNGGAACPSTLGSGDVKVEYQLLVCATPSRGTAAERSLSDPSARTEVRNRRCARACAQMSPARPTCANRRTETQTPRDSAVLRLRSPPRCCVRPRFEHQTRGSLASVWQAPQMIGIPRERHAPQALG